MPLTGDFPYRRMTFLSDAPLAPLDRALGESRLSVVGHNPKNRIR